MELRGYWNRTMHQEQRAHRRALKSEEIKTGFQEICSEKQIMSKIFLGRQRHGESVRYKHARINMPGYSSTTLGSVTSSETWYLKIDTSGV